MKTENPGYRKPLIIITLITFSFSLYIQMAWAIVATSSSYLEKDDVQSFLHFFPPFARNMATITYLTLFFSIITVVLSAIWIQIDSGISKVIATIILMTGLFVTIFTLFQIM